MCGRSSFPSKLKIVSHYNCKVGPSVGSSFDKPSVFLPGENIPMIVPNRLQELVLVSSVWGFGEYYNARIETIDQKNLWREQYKTSRAVIPLTTFFEGSRWFDPGKIVSAAAIFRVMIKPSGDRYFESSMITTQATDPISRYHERMPLLLNDDMVKDWIVNGLDDLNLDSVNVDFDIKKTLS